MFSVDSGLILWEIITFILLLVVLRLYAWKPLRTALKKREQSIRQAIEDVEQARRDAERLLKTSRTALRQTEREFNQIKQRCEPVLGQIRDAALAAAVQHTDRILNDSKEEIQRMKEQAMQQLRAEIGELVVECAAVTIDKTLDDEKHCKLIENALQSLPLNGRSEMPTARL